MLLLAWAVCVCVWGGGGGGGGDEGRRYIENKKIGKREGEENAWKENRRDRGLG